MKVYVASSWRNEGQPEVVSAVREAGHDVYDFRNPSFGNRGFHWSEIDPEWKSWTPEHLRQGLGHTLATHGLGLDLAAMMQADAFVLVNPSGKSAHLELGWALGAGKIGLILLSSGEPELMYGLAHHLCLSVGEVIEKLSRCPKASEFSRS